MADKVFRFQDCQIILTDDMVKINETTVDGEQKAFQYTIKKDEIVGLSVDPSVNGYNLELFTRIPGFEKIEIPLFAEDTKTPFDIKAANAKLKDDFIAELFEPIVPFEPKKILKVKGFDKGTQPSGEQTTESSDTSSDTDTSTTNG